MDMAVRNQLAVLPYSYRPALALAMTQQPDGTWNTSMLGVPSPRAEGFQGVGTVNAVRRLLEYGWEQDSPPLVHARRVLFRLLAEDDDPAYLFELAPRGKLDPQIVNHGRSVLREAAAAALAQAGYENDPRLRGAASRMVDRLGEYLRSPAAEKPFRRVGNQHVLVPEAAPPSVHLITMLGYMQLFRSEHYDTIDRLYRYLSHPVPRAAPAAVVARKVVALPHLMLGDPLPHRQAADADVPWALVWLELAARMGWLRRHEGWTKLLDRFLAERDENGVWSPPKGASMMRTTNPFVWPSYPLESQQATGDDRWSDVTFRLGLIARLAGRQLVIS